MGEPSDSECQEPEGLDRIVTLVYWLQEEMFEMNWIEYVRRDTEGSDSDTRRRSASELVRALTERFPAQVCVCGRGWVGVLPACLPACCLA